MNLTIARVAWRNLWRHPQRTILMIATVAVGSLVILVLFGLSDGVIGSMTATQIDWNQGNFQVRATAYADDPIPENGLSPDQVKVAMEALATMQTEAITPRLEVTGIIRSAYGTDGVMIRGVNPESERLVTHLDELIIEGSYLNAEGQVLLSDVLASLKEATSMPKAKCFYQTY